MNWRPMKTAPKDGTHILLAVDYGHEDGLHVETACWVGCVPEDIFSRAQRKGLSGDIRDQYVAFGQWRAARLAVIEHSGPLFGNSFEARDRHIHSPVGWQPMPASPRRK